MTLVSQVSRIPTRKIMAVIISGMLVGGLQSALHLFWPDHPFAPYMEYVDVWFQGMIMVLAGYATREKEYVVVDETAVVQKSDSGVGGELSLTTLRMDEEKTGGVGEGKPVVIRDAGETP